MPTTTTHHHHQHINNNHSPGSMQHTLNLNATPNANGSEYSLPPSYRAPLVHNANETSSAHLERTFTSSTSITNAAQQQQQPPADANGQHQHQLVLIEVTTQTKPGSSHLGEVITHQHCIGSAAVDVHNNNNDFGDDGLDGTKIKTGDATETNVDASQVRSVPDDDATTADGSDAITLITGAADGGGLVAADTPTKRRSGDLVTIVTISGCTETESSTGEMDILAHL